MRLVDGSKVAMFVSVSKVTTPVTAAPAVTVSSRVAVEIVSGSMGSLNVALMVLFVQIPTAPVKGFIEVTVGGVMSGATPVVKLQLKAAARPLPAASCAPVPICALQLVLAGNAAP